MASEVKATLDDTEIRAKLARIADKIKNGDSLLKSSFNIFGFRDIQSHFEQEKGPDGPWQKRSSFTQDMYAAISSGRRNVPKGMDVAAGAFNPSNKILQLTGRLRGSILPSGIKSEGKDAIRVFANAPYSGKHDRGDASKRLPKRQFMWLSQEATRKMARHIVDEVNK
jgi:phage gpG-like protein